MIPMGIFFALSQPSGAEGGNPFIQFAPIILIFVVFYFLLIRPQQKRQKEHKGMVEELKRGDNVITAGGIHGTVTAVADNIATVEIANNVRIKVTRSSVAAVKKEGQPT
jgi:preprotein translocase subunit YajC